MIRALELFCCSGGIAEGFRHAGITIEWAFDADPNACESYERNLGHRPIQMDVRDLVRMVRGGWSPGPLDLLIADPPCTPWSRAGKRLGVADERDMLEETVGLVRLLRPAAYLIGNVPGLQDATQWHHVQEHIGGLANAGYCVADYVQIDAASYGVPQHRIRPWWFGHLAGPCIRWPASTHGPPGQIAIPGCELKPWVICRDALQHLPLEQLGRPVRMRIREAGEDTPRSGGDQRHPISNPNEPSFTVRTNGGRASQAAFMCEWPWDRPATNIMADDRIPPPGHHDYWSTRSQPNAIILSERAATILQGFPETWTFAGKTKKARWSQIGQATPPPMAEAVARSIVAQMEATERKTG